jgi:hypothetical protein
LIVCPRCKSEDYNLGKSWDVLPKTGKGKAMRVTLYSCKTCGYKFRKALKLDIPTVPVPTREPFPLTKSTDVIAVPVSGEMSSYIKEGKIEIAGSSLAKTAPPEVPHPTLEAPHPTAATQPHRDSFVDRIRKGFQTLF